MKTREIRITLEFNKQGIARLPRVEGAALTAKVFQSDNTIAAKGNAEGLRFLATALLGLAEADAALVRDGYHVHVDDLYELNSDGVAFILYRDDDL